MSDNNNERKGGLLQALRKRDATLARQDEDEGQSGRDGGGPACDTYARIISDLGGSIDPKDLQKFIAEHGQEVVKDQGPDKKSQTTSQEFSQNRAEEKEKRSEEEYNPAPEQAFNKRWSGPKI